MLLTFVSVCFLLLYRVDMYDVDLGVSFSLASLCLLLLLRVGYKWLNKLLSMGTLIDTIFHLTIPTPQLYSSLVMA